MKNKRMIYIPLGLIIFMCMGTIYSYSVFRKSIETAFNISATQSGLPYMFFLVFYAFTMPIAGGYIDKYGPRIVTIVGGSVVAIGWILSGFTTNIFLLIITYGVIAGTGVGIAYGAPMAVAGRWFPEKKGLAVGLTLAGFGLSPFVTAPIANILVTKHGAFSTFKILGISFFILIFILSLPLKFPEKTNSNDENLNNSNMVELKFKKLFKNKKFIALWSCYSIGTLVGLMAIGISSPIAIEIIKLSPSKAAFMVSFFAIFNGIGRPIYGSLTDSLSPKKASVLSFILIICASLLMIIVKEGQIFLFGFAFAIFWFNLGGWLAIAPATTFKFWGSKYYSKNYGFVFTSYGIGAIIGNLLSGYIRDTFGSYQYVFYPTIVFSIIGIFISIMFLNNDNKVIEDVNVKKTNSLIN